MKHILIVEDEERTRENLALILEMEGYHVATASNGWEGLALLETKRPDLILCDVTMPELNGHAFLTAVRNHPAVGNIPFVFITAHGERADFRVGMNLGADDYLVKPVGASELLACVEARLRRAEEADSKLSPDFSSPEPLLALGLTPREAEVLLWVAQGKSNAEISCILSATENGSVP